MAGHLMLWIGLTGGIATGKSTVAELLRQRGYVVVDADELARDAVQNGTPAFLEIVRAFGPDSVLPTGELNRRRLGEIVFGDPAKLALLESIVHPHVRALALKRKVELEDEGVELAFYDIPLLFEKDMEALFDHVTVVATKPEIQLARLMSRNRFTEEEAKRRIASQLPLQHKIAKAKTVIHNDSSLKDLDSSVDLYLLQLGQLPRKN